MADKCAVVTGASKGIGLEIAKGLLADGYRVFGFARSRAEVSDIDWIRCDVTDSQSVTDAFKQVIEQAGKLDLLVVNAGMGISGAAEFAGEADYRRQFEVNVFGAIACAKEAAHQMRSQRSGKIIFISSLAAIFPIPFQSYYAASKAGVNAFSDALGIELKPFGVETCTVMLNDVKTEFTENRIKTAEGDDIYQGRISASVAKMEQSEQHGMSPVKVADTVRALVKRRNLPAHKIVGISNEFLGLLYRVLPANAMLWILAKIYG
ncbi:SDR family oxidoreductase [Anaerovoracaceae bacterium 42-11]